MNEINKIDEFEIKEKNDSTSLNDSAKQNEIEKNFYAAKMKNITEGGIYNLVKDLCQQFCWGKEHTINIWNEEDFNKTTQGKHAKFQTQYETRYQELANKPNVFVPPNFSGPEPKNSGIFSILLDNDKKFEPFMFFEKVDPNKFSGEVKNNPEAIANYVKQFANYLSELFKDSDFTHFLISSEKNIETLGKIIGSDFVLKGDKKNPELFKESHLLDVGTSLVGEYNSYCECYDDETEKTHANKKKLKSLILDYLKQTFGISNEALCALLFNNDFYKIFADTENMNKIIIDAIKKTDFHSYTFGRSCDSINGLNSLLKKCEEKNKKNEKNKLDKTEDCFYDKNRDGIDNALADKCAEIFADTKESVKINLETLTVSYKCSCVCNFMSNYLSDKKNRDSETREKLINALKTWLDNNDLLLWEYSFKSEELNKYIIELFLYDNELKKSFANACARTIKHLIDKDAEQWGWNLLYCQSKLEEVKTKSKLFLDKFGVVLENYDFSKEPYKTHGKNIAWLSFWIFLALICIVGTIILSNVALLTVVKIIVLIIVWLCFLFKIFPETFKRARYIHDDRIYNAKLDINKSKTRTDAKNRLYWDMSKIDKVKQCLNLRFPDDEQNDENKNLKDV